MKSTKSIIPLTDVVLIGAGVMSATLGTMLKILEPGFKIEIFERLGEVGAESSVAMNNAGTGHSGFCELNYTPQQTDGSVEIKKALKIAEQFEVSKQFWSFLVESKLIQGPGEFIRKVPHMSFVWGANNVNFLKARYNALSKHHFFSEMQYSEDHTILQQWIPLIMNGSGKHDQVAATRMDLGTDINFGALTNSLIKYLTSQKEVKLSLNTEVIKIERLDANWLITIKNIRTGAKRSVLSKFVFIGAGGGSLPLLQKSGIPESKGFGGFPVSGEWLVCNNPEVIAQHTVKVYGKAEIGSPPMSVPHLDSRLIDGQRQLLFGPYAGFSTKFLKKGSFMDLFKSIKWSNIYPLIRVGLDNIPLTKYLIDQVRQSPDDRLAALKKYYPEAKLSDWKREVAGQRVQVIKKHPEHGGVLEFGTEVVVSHDGSIAALLGASPGASTSVSIMLELIERCFGAQVQSDEWQTKLRHMIQSYGKNLDQDAELASHIRTYTTIMLGIG
ncbi:malate dehydrogenase (quinone) [Mucilaginibacter aquaedulcis]|uniref:malate dehydrogenase (quinone) n=1 Tax=Mucilaginibacter aquaedulcis TaxID=1187081 RepID=UPI0025B2F0FC|nr:malate dehydrogenase (quinone) [Mucilaginibacter aquaedulcis]MDN3548623.1 malate dehydrogenase (quinone) [Mucilaginibacter aquaedulcis]